MFGASWVRMLSLLGVVAVVFSLPSVTSADLLITFPATVPSMDTQGDPSNTTFTWTSSQPRFLLGERVNYPSGELHSLHIGAVPSQSRIRMTCSRYAGLYKDFQIFTVSSGYTLIPVPSEDFPFSDDFEFKEVLPGDTISFEFYQSTNLVPNVAEAEWFNLAINIHTYDPVIPPAEDLGILTNGVQVQNDPIAPNQIKWYKFRILTDTLANRYLDIDSGGSTDLIDPNVELGLYDADGFKVAASTGIGSGLGALSFAVPQPWNGRSALFPSAIIANGVSGTLTAGTYYLAVGIGFPFFQPNGFLVSQVSPLGGDGRISFAKGVDAGPAWPPASFTELGTIAGSGSITANVPFLGGKWYRFNVGAIQSPGWLDIENEGTTDFLAAPLFYGTDNDTFLALYDSNGYGLKWDSSDGSLNRALLSFGDTVFRGWLSTGSDHSVHRTGQDGNLPAGTYYLYVGGDSTLPSSTYPGAAPTNNHCSGPIEVNFRYCSPSKRTVTGRVVTYDWVGDPVIPFFWELLDGPGGSVVESGTSATTSGGYYNLQLNTMSGTGYVLVLQLPHWLKAAAENLSLNTNLRADITCFNGDIDHDNEVGPGDFGALSSAFGSVDGDSNWDVMADLDGDGEVGPSDFGILSANFGMSGY